MNNSKSNFNQALWLAIGYTCSMAVGIVSSAILSRYFDKTEYGTYKQIMYVYHILFTVFQAGLPAVFTYFLPRYGKEEGKYIVKKINGLLFILGAFCSVFLFCTSGFIASLLKNPELATGLKIFSFFPLFTLPTLGVEGIYTVNKNTRFVAIYNVITRLLMLVCIVIPVIFIKNDYRYALVGWGIASFIAFIIAIVAKNRVYSAVETKEIPNMFREVLSYTLPIMGSALVFMFFNSASQFFISRYYGTEAFAEYSNGHMTLPFAAIFIAPIRALITPAFAKASKDNNFDSALAMLYNSTKQLFVIMLPLIAFAFFFAKDIMVFLYSEAYAASASYFRIILMFNVVEMFVFSSVLNAIGKSKQHFIFDISCTIVLWGLDFLLVYAGGNPYLITAAFVLMNSTCRYILPGIYLYFHEKIHVLNREIISCFFKVFIHVVLCCGLTYLLSLFVLDDMKPFYRLIMFIIVFYLILLASARWIVKIDYLQALTKLIKKK